MMDFTKCSLADLQHMLTILPEEIERRRALERARVIEELAALARAHGSLHLPQALKNQD